MRWSNLFIPTLREDPADAEVVSHRLLVRAGYIRQLTAGVYSLLPLGQRVRLKVMEIIREEMNRIGAQEFLLPALHPGEIWKESGRWDIMGDNLFRLRDRRNTEMALGMTHEEVFTSIARNAISSYRHLPQVWYQIQTKFRDEARPKSGLLRVREFTMKDAYSFDVDRAGLDKSFQDQHDAYCRIFTRCGLKFTSVEASSGAMGGSQSTEFMVKTPAGEDNIAHCKKCAYSANVEKATSKLEPAAGDEGGPDEPEKFATPGIRTIDDLISFPGGAAADRQIKTLIFILDGKLTLVLMRGDHELNETKLMDSTGSIALRPAQPEEIKAALGALPGSLGAVAVTPETHKGVDRIVADHALKGRRNMTTGANIDDFHLRGVDVEKQIKIDAWADLRSVKAGENCPKCDSKLEVFKAVEIGHIFKLGTRYSDSMGARVLTAEGQEVPIVMGSYGIGVERVMVAAVELFNDQAGIIWPVPIAPFHVVVTPVNVKETEQLSAATRLYSELQKAGVEALLDDRDERAGVKFNDAELIGLPFRVTVGKKIKQGKVELMARETRASEDIELDRAAAELASRINSARHAPFEKLKSIGLLE
ncbi:MAG TPA: proline--tRNA ligase [Blastocatellia bacterium]|nr:proline--tRNA ligase [Blastocatellia bacterium]